MNEPLNILIATPNDEVFEGFQTAFSRFDVDVFQATSYTEAIEELQNGNVNLLISDYFLEAGEHLEDAFDVRTWETDTIEHDIKICGVYRDALIWLRNLIATKDREQLFPLGRRLSIEADLIPTKTILLIPFDPMYKEESEDIALYLSLYRDNMYQSRNETVQEMAQKIVGLIIKNHFLALKKIF